MALYGGIAPQGFPGGQGLTSFQNGQAIYGPNIDDLKASADAVKQIVGPNYDTINKYIQGVQNGTFTAGNLGVVFEPVQPATQFVHEQIAPGLKELVGLFQLVKLDPTQQVIQKRFMVFNSSHWSRITDLMTGRQDMSTLFTANASVIQYGKSAEMELKAFRSPQGATLWYNILKQAATGYINSVIHTCVAALLDCSPSKLAGAQLPLQPYAIPITFREVLEMNSDMFGILGKGVNSLLTLFDYANQEAMRRGISGFNSLICNKGTLNRVQKSMVGQPSLLDSWRNVPTEQDATMFILKHSEFQRLLEVGPVSVGPNSAKVLPFLRRVNIWTHNIIDGARLPADRTFTTYNRVTDDFERVRITNVLNRAIGAPDNECLFLVFTSYEAETESMVFLASGVENGPELHLSPILDGVAFHSSQFKLTYNAAFSVAAHVPNKNTIWFAEHTFIRGIRRGPRGNGTEQHPGELRPNAFVELGARYAVRIRKTAFDSEWVKFTSFTGMFPAHMTGEENVQCWAPGELKCHNVIQAFQPGSLVLPDSFDDEGTRFPIVSSLEYTEVGDNVTMCDGFFGQNCYKGCVKALTCSGIHRAFNNDPNSLRLEVPQNRVPVGIQAAPINPIEE